MPDPRAYVVISPGRNEADYMRRTLDSMIAQTERPTAWVIVDDGSTDDSPEILAGYAAQHDWITIVRREDRGRRAVGPGVIEAFYAGLDTVSLDDYTYLCKLDLDLDLPPTYFAGLMDRMEANPRVGTCSGKTWYAGPGGQQISEGIGDEMSIGASKFMRVACFRQIGGFVREVMWDGIDCHKARAMGWIAVSWDAPELQFEHLRPMGSSQQNIHAGRRRHGLRRRPGRLRRWRLRRPRIDGGGRCRRRSGLARLRLDRDARLPVSGERGERRIGEAAAPAELCAFRLARHPGRLLVIVREQAFGLRRRLVHEFGPGQRLDQRSDIADNGGIAGIEQAFDAAQFFRQGELAGAEIRSIAGIKRQ